MGTSTNRLRSDDLHRVNDDPLVLGIDPGLGITGYGVVRLKGSTPQLREAGVIRCTRGQSLEKRLNELFDGVQQILDAHSGITVMAMEQLYSHYDRPTTAILMGHARGVLCLCAARAGLVVHSYMPTQLKKMLTGNGRAPKNQMQQAVQQQLKLKCLPEPADVADALAVALCHYYACKSVLAAR